LTSWTLRSGRKKFFTANMVIFFLARVHFFVC
jgi:hypothetical protein